ncbi:MAG: hypothetical protein Hyperionvirus3_63 [Hyperionvirus sp.]|uniref:Uncharacterized protein n=1 Tax=Hyperionvirus sp. TaxID=2487770 RepID=A0A3G5A6P6_9VIRU|nr:MAG: hypothetical protein Hyperionvirus3_63 [Hyperionvirus sp.]
MEELERANNTGRNLEIIKEAYQSRDAKVKGDRYSKSCVVAKFIDQDMIEPLKAIYNLLNNLNDRITKLEKNSNLPEF